MSCNDDMDFLGIPNVDLSKWKTVNRKDVNDVRLKNVEEIVQDTNLIVKRILSKLEDHEEEHEKEHSPFGFDRGISFDDDFDYEFDK